MQDRWLLQGSSAAYDQHVLRGILDRIRRSDAWRRRSAEHHLLGFGRTDPAPAAARLPRHPDRLLRSDAWQPITQLADQRIRAHRGDHLSVGEIVETVAHEVEGVVAHQSLETSLVAWRAWAAATETPWPAGFHELLVGAPTSPADEIEAAVHVQTDLVALVPQVVAARYSENRG